jgi:hypothetical protein
VDNVAHNWRISLVMKQIALIGVPIALNYTRQGLIKTTISAGIDLASAAQVYQNGARKWEDKEVRRAKSSVTRLTNLTTKASANTKPIASFFSKKAE